MTRKLFLHVGMPKCATTTLQGFLRAERAALARHGLGYAMPAEETDWQQGNGAHLAALILHGDTRWKDLIDTHLEEDGDAIISSEGFFGLFNVKTMSEVAAHLRGRGVETVVVAYLRRQDLWLESDYKQQVKTSQPWADPLPDWIARRDGQDFLNYAMTLTYFGKWFGRQNIRPVLLRPGQPQGHAIDAFLNIVGAERLSGRRAARAAAHNVSPPTGLIEPARMLKRRLLDTWDDPDRVQQAVRVFFRDAPDVVEIPRRKYLMSSEKRAAIVRLRRRANEDLRERFLDGPAFDQDVEHDPESERPLGPEAEALLEAYLAARGLPDPDAAAEDDAPPAPGGLARIWRRFGRTGG